MTTTARLAGLTLAMAANTLLTHALWRTSSSEAGPGAERAAAPAPVTWAAEGFRDEGRCEMLSEPPECD